VYRLLAKAPLRLVLVIPFVLQIGLAVGVTGWFTIQNGQQAVDRVAHQLWEEVANHTLDRLVSYMAVPQEVTTDTAALVQAGLLPADDPALLTRYLWDQMRYHEGLFIAAVGYATGEVVGVGVESNGDLVVRARAAGQTHLHTYSLSAQGERGILLAVDPFELERRPWYAAAAVAQQPLWTGVYPNYTTPYPLISAVSPIYSPDAGELLGVTNATLTLGQLSDFLETLPVGESGQVFITERSGDLVATSSGEALTRPEPRHTRRVTMAESTNPLVRGAAAYLQQEYGDLATLPGRVDAKFMLQGEPIILQVTPFTDSWGLDWLVVVTVPETEVMAPIYASTRQTVLLCVGALGVATLLGMATARWIARPLLHLNHAARALAEGHQAARVSMVPGRTREVRELVQSFQQMARQLQTSFAALQASEANFRSMAANVPGAIIRYVLHTDGTDSILYSSPGCEALWELPDRVIQADAQRIWAMVLPEDRAGMQNSVLESARTLQPWNCEWRIVTPSGKLKWLHGSGNPTRQPNGDVVWGTVILDVSDRKQAEAQLIHRTFHDALTDLPNRSLLTQRLDAAIERLHRGPGTPFALLFLDLDHFKVINDSMGHMVGDQLLVALGQTLNQQVTPPHLVARLGGDEFVILLEAVTDLPQVLTVAGQVSQAIEQTALVVNQRSVSTTTSIGLVYGTAAYHDAADVLRDADIALYRAKARGRNRYEIFDAAMHLQVVERMNLAHDLSYAIEREELQVYYQPIVSLRNLSLKGFEALVRWNHPQRGMVSPADFVPIAEETGLVVAIDRWVMQTACRQMAQWRSQFPHLRSLKVSVNLSGQDLSQPDLVQQVRHTLTQTALAPEALTLELTESMLIENVETTIDLLGQLRDQGVRISIDDFGTGYSSLSYLYNLPADYLKIDQSFVKKMAMGNKNYKIVRAIVALSNQLQIEAIAEGIEYPRQFQWLQALQCELGQGYLFSAPLTATAAAEMLAQHAVAPYGAFAMVTRNE